MFPVKILFNEELEGQTIIRLKLNCYSITGAAFDTADDVIILLFFIAA